MEQSDYRKPRILILAADEDSRALYSTLLKIWNYDAVTATSAKEILSLTETYRPNVVLMDTQIDLSDSLSVMKKLRAEKALCNIPFVLLSGHAQPEARLSVIAAGAKDFCVKPVDFNVLRTILKDCLSKNF